MASGADKNAVNPTDPKDWARFLHFAQPVHDQEDVDGCRSCEEIASAMQRCLASAPDLARENAELRDILQAVKDWIDQFEGSYSNGWKVPNGIETVSGSMAYPAARKDLHHEQRISRLARGAHGETRSAHLRFLRAEGIYPT